MSSDKYLFQAIVEQVSNAIIFADRQGVIRLWNAGAEAVFGYSSEEVIGQSLDVIIPERLRPAHWKAFDKAVETGRTKYGRQVMVTSSIHKTGKKLYVDLSFAIVSDGSGEVVGAAAVASDATERYLAEAALRKQVAELEAQLKTASAPPSPG
ncbi:MAG: PAS domain-containing protein [Gammaproteobacteria bacterium]